MMKPQQLFGAPAFRARHYVLKSPVNRESDQLWVIPVKRRIAGLREEHGDAFALAVWNFKETEHFRYTYVIPFALMARMFEVPINRPKDNGWDLSIRKVRLFVAGAGGLDVSRCRGDQPNVVELVQATQESVIRELLGRVADPKSALR